MDVVVNSTESNTTSGMSLLILINFSVMMSACVLVTVFGNILVILSVFTYRPLRNVQNFYIVSLACADLAVAILVMPFNVINFILDGRWIFGAVFCNVWLTSDILTCTASILNLCGIALDRYKAIHDPIGYTQGRTVRRVLLAIGIVWLVSAVISVPPLIGWNNRHGQSLYVEETQTCQLNDDKGFVIYSASGSFYIPLALMTFVYVRIFLATRARLRTRASAKTTTYSSAGESMADRGRYCNTQTMASMALPPMALPRGGAVANDDKSCYESFQPDRRTPEMDIKTGIGKRFVQTAGIPAVIIPTIIEPMDNECSCHVTSESNDNYILTHVTRLRLSANENNVQTGNDVSTGVSGVSNTNHCGMCNDSTAMPEVNCSGNIIKKKPDVNDTSDNKETTSGQAATVSVQLAVQTACFCLDSLDKPAEWVNLKHTDSVSAEQCRTKWQPTSGIIIKPEVDVDCLTVVSGFEALATGSGDSSSMKRLRSNSASFLRFWVRKSICSLQPDSEMFEPASGRSKVREFWQQKQRMSQAKERRIARTMAVIMAAFVVCWLPFFLMYVIFPFCQTCAHATDPILVNFIVWLGYINSTLNPIIYTIFNVDFRRAFKALLRGRNPSARRKH